MTFHRIVIHPGTSKIFSETGFLLKPNRVALWIEHDAHLYGKLKKSPAFIE